MKKKQIFRPSEKRTPQYFVPQPPSWFEARNALQADTVSAMQKTYIDANDVQRRQWDEAREKGLPKMSETVRDWDSRSNAQITGHMRPWAGDAYERVRRNKWRKQHPVCAFFKSFLLLFS